MKNKKNIFYKLYREFRQSGFSGILYKISEYEYFPVWLFHFSRSNIYIYEGAGVYKYNYRDKQDKYEFNLATKVDIPKILKLTGIENKAGSAPADRLNQFFDNENCFYVIKIDGEIIAYLMLYKGEYKLTRDDYKSINLNISLDNNVMFFGYGFIEPKYRMRGLFPYMMNYAMSHNDGAIFVTDIADLNKHSHKSHIKLGFRTIYSLVAARFFSKKLIFWKLYGERSISLANEAEVFMSKEPSGDAVFIKKLPDLSIYPSRKSLNYR